MRFPGCCFSGGFGICSLTGVSRSPSRRMLRCHSRASLRPSIATTDLASFLLHGVPASGSRFIYDGVSPLNLPEVAAHLRFDDGTTAPASLPPYNPGVTPAETCVVHLRFLCPGLPHRKQLAPIEEAAVRPASAHADERPAILSNEPALGKSFLR